MKKITEKQVEQLRAAQDREAQKFWAYPDSAWQAEFQAAWLWSQVGTDRAQSPDGLVWGSK